MKNETDHPKIELRLFFTFVYTGFNSRLKATILIDFQAKVP
jgi:hypothetical protein